MNWVFPNLIHLVGNMEKTIMLNTTLRKIDFPKWKFGKKMGEITEMIFDVIKVEKSHSSFNGSTSS